MLILVGVLIVGAGTLLISPDVRDAVWSLRARINRAGSGDSGHTPAFDDRLMTVAIVIALLGVGLMVAGFVRAA